MVSWTRSAWTLDPSDLQWILAQEDRSLTFTELLKDNSSRSFWPRPQGVLWAHPKEGFVAIKGHSLVIPFLPPDREAPPRWPRSVFEKLATYFSIIGPEDWVEKTQTHFKVPPYKTIQYFRMILEEEPPAWEIPLDMEVLPVGWENASLVYPLQEAYEKEEVLFSAQEFHRTSSYLAFQKSLKTQKVLALFHRGQPIAKAHTNAQGFHWNQLGGIYTLPGFRGLGLAKVVVSALCSACLQEKKKITLFVKKQNLPALGLYRALGFQTAENYRIAYFQKPDH